MSKDTYPPKNLHFEPHFYDRKKPPSFKLKRFIYNEQENTVLGRTSKDWGKNQLVLIICRLAKFCVHVFVSRIPFLHVFFYFYAVEKAFVWSARSTLWRASVSMYMLAVWVNTHF